MPWSLRFRGRKRRRPVDQIVIHETVTDPSKGAEPVARILKKRRLSTNYIIDGDGKIWEACKPERYTAHAGSGHNARSVGVDVCSRYYGHAAKRDQTVIDARWAHKGRYIVPELEVLEATWKLCRWLVIAHDIDLVFPNVGPDGWRWGRLKDHSGPGLYPHHAWAHADGTFPTYFMLMRSAGLSSERALSLSIHAASSGKRVTPLPVGLVCEDWTDHQTADWMIAQ